MVAQAYAWKAILLFYYTRVLSSVNRRAPSEITDRNANKLCHTIGFEKGSPKFAGFLPENVSPKALSSGGFTTTSPLKREYLRDETRAIRIFKKIIKKRPNICIEMCYKWTEQDVSYRRANALQGALVLVKSGRTYDYLQPLWHSRPAKLANSVEISKIRAITPFKVVQGHRGRYQSKAPMRLPIGTFGSDFGASSRYELLIDEQEPRVALVPVASEIGVGQILHVFVLTEINRN